MEVKRYRTIPETIALFREYARSFENDAHLERLRGNWEEYAVARAKAEAYEIAAFELEHNADWKGEKEE